MALTPEARAFVEEWENTLPYVTAHTSGSTGKPKEVRLLKADMSASARGTLDFFGLGRESKLLLPLAPSYIAGKMQIVRALTAGCALHTELPSRTPFAGVDPSEVPLQSMAAIVPAQIEGLLAARCRNRIGAVIVGGAAIPPHLEELLLRHGVNAYATYGMTETCSHVALRRLGTESYRGLPGFRFSTDGRGCLVIDTDVLSVGRVVTNDMVELRGDDEFRYLGRYDNVINSGGVKIHPEELERFIAPLVPAPYAVYVTSRRSAVWGEEAVVVTDWSGLTHMKVAQAVEALAPYLRPKDIIVRDGLPRTSSGKIIRKKLR